MAAAGEDDGLAGPDVHGFTSLVDVAVLPEALKDLAGLRVIPGRIVCPYAKNPTREGLLANDLVEAAVQHELEAL
ncbi:MAG: hypothetical protein ACKVIN_10030, partial [Longimicrobiales bacterium]